MRRLLPVSTALLVTLTAVTLTAATLAAAGPATATTKSSEAAMTAAGAGSGRYVPCNRPVAAGQARCLSIVHRSLTRTKAVGPFATAEAKAKAIPGLKPADIRAAYRLPKTGAKNQTVAIVDAFDNPNVEKDLAVYRSVNHLPACTTANKCFRKVDQRGTKKYPEGDIGWGIEISLDVQAVSASCPGCKILLVEADEPSTEDLGLAVNTAVRLGAKVISNSYGADESSADAAASKKYYTHPGVAIVASSGDYGFTAASAPAVMPNVWAIGGTLLNPTKTGYSEKAWEYAGSGCSAYVQKPAYQKDKNCGMRTISDLSAAADSKDGFAVYDTYGQSELKDFGFVPVGNWIGVGGTSLSSPLIAGMIGLAGNAAKAAAPSYPYSHRSGLQDIVGGSNGYCGNDYLCTGVKGYDGPTGLGSPRGLKSL